MANEINIDEFLRARDIRLHEIQILLNLFKIIGQNLENTNRQSLAKDNYDDGCIYQFFAFIQGTVCQMMFVNFMTIIGGYNKKEDKLKSWDENILPTNFSNSEEVIYKLKAIRKRYADIRNDRICHIDHRSEVFNEVHTQHVHEDIAYLKKLLMNIHMFHNPKVIKTEPVDAPQDFPPQGLEKILEILKNHASLHDEKKDPEEYL
jgi:hypothetical protein